MAGRRLKIALMIGAPLLAAVGSAVALIMIFGDTPEDFTRSDVRAVAQSAIIFRERVGHWPATVDEMAPPKCVARGCVIGEAAVRDWRNLPYALEATDGGVAVRSAGADKRLHTDDDITASAP